MHRYMSKLYSKKIKSATEFHLFPKKGNLICIFIWQQNTCKYTKAHSCSSFTPLIAKPKTTKHNNLSKYFKT